MVTHKRARKQRIEIDAGPKMIDYEAIDAFID
jgi:hypothetical protein